MKLNNGDEFRASLKETSARLARRSPLPGESFVLSAQHQHAAAPLHLRIVTLLGILSVLCIVGGIVAIVWNAMASTEFKLLGASLTTGHVGVAFVGIGMLTAFFSIRAVLNNQRELAALPSDEPTRSRPKKKRG